MEDEPLFENKWPSGPRLVLALGMITVLGAAGIWVLFRMFPEEA